MQRAAEQAESVFRTLQTPREPGTLVSCKLDLAVIQSLLIIPSCAGFRVTAPIKLPGFSFCRKLCPQRQDQNAVSTGLLTQIVTKKVNNLKSQTLLWRREQR